MDSRQFDDFDAFHAIWCMEENCSKQADTTSCFSMRHLGINPSLKLPTLRNFCNTLNALSDALVRAKLSENLKFQHPTKTMEKPTPWTYKNCIKKCRLCQTTSFWVSRCFKMSWRSTAACHPISHVTIQFIETFLETGWNCLRKNLWQCRISRGLLPASPKHTDIVSLLCHSLRPKGSTFGIISCNIG